jgi:hypothetical protein
MIDFDLAKIENYKVEFIYEWLLQSGGGGGVYNPTQVRGPYITTYISTQGNQFYKTWIGYSEGHNLTWADGTDNLEALAILNSINPAADVYIDGGYDASSSTVSWCGGRLLVGNYSLYVNCADGNVYMCTDTRGCDWSKLTTHYPDPKNVINYWGSTEHLKKIEAIDFHKSCDRCTLSPYNEMIEQVFQEDKMDRNLI